MHKKKTLNQVSGSVFVSCLEDKQKIVACFPKIELSQETLLHQKVLNADIYVAIPYGIKYFAWVTTKDHVGLSDDNRTNNNVICLFIEAGNNNHLASQNIFYVSLGQISEQNNNWINHYIFHGILFTETTKNKNTYFASNFIYDLKTAHIVGHKTFKQTMQTLHYIFNQNTFVKQIRDFMIHTYSLHFGAPIMHPKFSELLTKLQDLPYNVQYIRFRYLEHSESEPIKFVKYFKPNKNKTLVTKSLGENTNESVLTKPNTNINNNIRRLSHAVFKVYPQRQQDTYKLYALNNETKEHLIDIAYIPNYKTSIMMNGIFRNVKENLNLDALEESDDEAEFENSDLDKFVDLKTTQNMMCEYSPKFKKWIPLNITTTHDIIKTSAMGI